MKLQPVKMLVRLLRRGLSEPLADPARSSLAFTLASVYVVFIVSVATVYLGLQAVPLLFLITGWAEGYLRSNRSFAMAPEQVARPLPVTHGFRRILA
jgi:hypothetical protein